MLPSEPCPAVGGTAPTDQVFAACTFPDATGYVLAGQQGIILGLDELHIPTDFGTVEIVAGVGSLSIDGVGLTAKQCLPKTASIGIFEWSRKKWLQWAALVF